MMDPALLRKAALWVLATVLVPSLNAATPQVWFAPFDSFYRSWLGFAGSPQYMSLFAADSPWVEAASHVKVFKVYSTWIDQASDADLQTQFTDLNRRGIALALEHGAITASSQCGIGVEGQGGEDLLKHALRIKKNGGTLRYVALDEPIYYFTLYAGANSCKWTVNQMAANAAVNIRALLAQFPEVIIGDIEPFPVSAPNWLSQYQAGIVAFRNALGFPLAFFHSDLNWNAASYLSDIASVRRMAASEGVPFGIIYDGNGTDTTDAQWIQFAIQRMVTNELAQGLPDSVIFQSWMPYPKKLLPESDPDSFTSLINRYARPRTSLTINPGSSEIVGKLTDSTGKAVISAPVTVVMQPSGGGGVTWTYPLAGTVPATTAQATVKICVNLCGSHGTNDMTVYSYRYTGSVNPLTVDFSHGLSGWGLWSKTAVLQLGSDSEGAFLHVSATATQVADIDAPIFAVAPGSSYNLAIRARVSADSDGSGYFAIVFLDSSGKEVSRDTLPFAPATLPLGTAQTAKDGSYLVQFKPQAPGTNFQVIASYAGSEALWPSRAAAALRFSPLISPQGIVSGTNFNIEAIPPGMWFTIFGENLGSAGTWTSENTVKLGGATVSVCSLPAVISYNSGPIIADGTVRWQLNILMPDGVAGKTSCPITVTVEDQPSATATVNIASGIMELFGFNSAAGRLPIVTHSDYRLVGPASVALTPAKAGELLIGWGTGDCGLPRVTVGGVRSSVIFSGRVALGLCQINFYVPEGLSGANSVQISSSPDSYTLWLQAQ